MLSSVLDSYVDEEGDAEGEGPSICGGAPASDAAPVASTATAAGGESTTAAAAAATTAAVNCAATGVSALSGFASPPRRKRVDLLRLQMFCPTIVGAAVDSEAGSRSSSREHRVSAHALFTFPLPRRSLQEAEQGSARPAVASDGRSSSNGAETSRSGDSTGSWQVKSELAADTSGGSRAPVATRTAEEEAAAEAKAVSHGRGCDRDHRTAAEEAGTAESARDKATAAAATVGSDGIPVLKYEQGVFHVAEVAAPTKECGGRRTQRQQHLGGAAVGSSSEGRGKKLLSMLPKPRHEQQQQQLGPVVQRIQQFSCSSRSRQSDVPSATDTGSSSSSSSRAAGGSSDSSARDSSQSSSSSCAAADDLEQHEKAGSDAEEQGRGSLFSLFSAYDDEPETVESTAVVKKEEKAEAESAGKRRRPAAVKDENPAAAAETTKLPLLGITDDSKDEEKSTTMASVSRIGVSLQQQDMLGSNAEQSVALPLTMTTEDAQPVTEEYHQDVWGSSDSAAAAFDSAAAQQCHDLQFQRSKIEGMSLNEYRKMQSARVKDVSGEALRDPDWELNYQLHATPAHAKRTKLNISTNVWSAKDKALVQTVEPRAMQKRKHQINWLAAEAAEKELEMWEMMAKTRQNKYNTSMKYGW